MTTRVHVSIFNHHYFFFMGGGGNILFLLLDLHTNYWLFLAVFYVLYKRLRMKSEVSFSF